MLPENEKKKIDRNVLIGFTTGEGGITPKDFKIFYPALHGSLVFAVPMHIMKFYKYGIFFAVSFFFSKMHKNVWTAFQKPFKVVFSHRCTRITITVGDHEQYLPQDIIRFLHATTTREWRYETGKECFISPWNQKALVWPAWRGWAGWESSERALNVHSISTKTTLGFWCDLERTLGQCIVHFSWFWQ